MLAFAFLLTACSDSEATHYGASAQESLDQIGLLVDDHAAAVRAATSMDDVTKLESSHEHDMASAMGDMHDMMDDMMGCGMSSMMSGSMHDADTEMADMMDEVADHADGHAKHSDMKECWKAEDMHSSDMHDHLDSMMDDMEDFDDDADCSSDGMGMGM